MPKDSPISRRDLLSAGAGAAAGLVAHKLGADTPAPPACGDATVAQTEGPFYPTRDRDD
jgi:hypothetical protein